MSFTSFKANWLGRRVDADGAYGYQCVDLIREYLAEERGLPKTGAWGNAINYWTGPVAQVLAVCDKIASTSPVAGDIVIFRTKGRSDYGGEGHIALSTGNDTNTQVEVLEQNGSTGSGDGIGGNAIRTRYVDRNRIAGLLRLKPLTQGTSNVTLTQADVEVLYQQILGRAGDAGGVKNYTGKTLDFAIRDMINSQEFKNRMASMYTTTVTKEVQTGTAATADQILGGQIIDLIRKV